MNLGSIVFMLIFPVSLFLMIKNVVVGFRYGRVSNLIFFPIYCLFFIGSIITCNEYGTGFVGEDRSVSNFQEGYWCVDCYNKCGYMNFFGKMVIPLEYDFSWPFNNGCAVVKKGEYWGAINKTNQIVIPFIYTNPQEIEKRILQKNN